MQNETTNKQNEMNHVLPIMLPTVSSNSAKEFPHIPIVLGSWYLVGQKGEFGLYEKVNQRMGGKELKVLHGPTGWMRSALTRREASLCASRYADKLNGKPEDFGGANGWGNTATFNWSKV